MKVLVTGANGFLGSWIVKGLNKKNFEVFILHRKTSDLSALKSINYKSFIGDITDIESLKEAMRGMDVVFHVAGLVSYKHNERAQMQHVNVNGTANVVEACIANKVKRLVHTSSIVTIGAGLDEQILNEDSPYNLTKYNLGYYETKKAAEDVVLKACKKNLIDAVVVNPSTMFGPGDATKSSRQKYLKVARGEFDYYPSGGVNILDVEDAVDGHILALEKGRSGERYILGNDNIYIKDLFDMFALACNSKPPSKKLSKFVLRSIFYLGSTMARLGLNVPFSYESAMIGSMYHWYSHEKAKKELGFNPRPAKQAILKSVQWCKEQNLL
ncbi:MAG: SDR family NAD(P)-dependent oxidoreductase [Oligoflexia bacterium]|nr:SDR family NAD(P)-dependent oxidoreductase [Oligoflexia bacterium]